MPVASIPYLDQNVYVPCRRRHGYLDDIAPLHKRVVSNEMYFFSAIEGGSIG